jgi:arginine decarboxylase
MRLLDSFPVLLVDDEAGDQSFGGRVTAQLTNQLQALGVPVITAAGVDDAFQITAVTPQLSAVLIDWDVHHCAEQALKVGAAAGGHESERGSVATAGDTLIRSHGRITMFAREVRALHPQLPILILSDRAHFDEIPEDLMDCASGYLAKLEDTPEFLAGRVQQTRRAYLDTLLPPFFKELVKFTEESHYSWHTPGHSGGAGFLKTPVGTALHHFFGENTLRSDLSVSVGELGSLLEHSGPVGAAEREAALTFGAQRTMFVTNGTSTANKIVFHACVGKGDVVLVDRNCHKSVMHAIVMTGAIPVYLHPVRNELGVIGPIPRSEFAAQHVRQLLAEHPLVPAGVVRARMAVVTNSTYDGLCYDPGQILEDLADVVDVVLFDEAWFGYAHFHPLYRDRHAMGARAAAARAGGATPTRLGARRPAVFATQSTHKLLTAFSQGSMVHLDDPDGVISTVAFEEAFMMHTSTSPQYAIIASLDVAARTMTGAGGTALVAAAIDEATRFRSEIRSLAESHASHGRVVDGKSSDRDWFFDVWQPPHVCDEDSVDSADPRAWRLHDGESWHGYPETGGQAMLDPIKVTVTTPGVQAQGLAAEGIPAAIVSRFLDERGIVVEKTGNYSLLVLFSLGITEGRSGTLIAELLEFKRLYDTHAPLTEALPKLVGAQGEHYREMTLRQLCDSFHGAMREVDLPAVTATVYEGRPVPVMAPEDAFAALVANNVELVPVAAAAGRTSAAMLVPYPPGIPVIMPGERYGDERSALIAYLTITERLARQYPGFETEVHGMQVQDDGGYRLPVLC